MPLAPISAAVRSKESAATADVGFAVLSKVVEYMHVTVIHSVQKNNTHSRFLLYLRGKCSYFHKKFQEIFRRKQVFRRYKKIRYSLLPVTSC